MAAKGIFDSLMNNPSSGSHSVSSRREFADNFVGSTAAAAAAPSFAFATPFAYRAFFGSGIIQTAYCDAGADFFDGDPTSMPREGANFGEYSTGMRRQVGLKDDGEILSEIHNKFIRSGKLWENNGLSTKHYDIELKPLFSALHWKNLALTSLRSFLLFYLPLLEPRARMEDEDDEDFLVEDVEEQRVDLVEPFKKSVKQIIRETSVVTTRRILERFAVHYASPRVAWKLLKDVPKSALRKAARGMPTCTFCYKVSKTTFRGHFLGVLASWAIQVGLDVYMYIQRNLSKSKKASDEVSDETHTTQDTIEEGVVLRKKVCGTTVRCVGSLVFASIGAGIGATMFRPSSGQKIGCVVGDLAGPIIIVFCCNRLNWEL